MKSLIILLVAFAPGIFWMCLIYSRDKYRPEPRSLVIKTFIYGMLAAIPVVIVELLLGGPSPEELTSGSLSIAQAFYSAFIVAGLVEELAKFFVVKKTVYHSPYFDEPIDGIIYASAAALGFASIENAGYIFSFGWEVMLVRGWFSTLAHVFFPALWAYALARKKVSGGKRNALVVVGLLMAIGLHGAFNFFLFRSDGYEIYTFILFALAAVGFVFLIRRANRESPYRDQIATPLRICPQCGHKNDYAANFCTNCGRELLQVSPEHTLFCSACHAPLQKDSKFCTSCGSRINKKTT